MFSNKKLSLGILLLAFTTLGVFGIIKATSSDNKALSDVDNQNTSIVETENNRDNDTEDIAIKVEEAEPKEEANTTQTTAQSNRASNNPSAATPEPEPEEPKITYKKPICGVLIKITPPGSSLPWQYEVALSSKTTDAPIRYRFTLNGTIVQNTDFNVYEFNPTAPGEYYLDAQIETAGGLSDKSSECSAGPIAVPIVPTP